MDEYFRNWRRKVGVFTLAMACVFVAGWVRSLSSQDTFVIPMGNKLSFQILSAYQRIVLLKYNTKKSVPLSNRPLWTSARAERSQFEIEIENVTGKISFDTFLYGRQNLKLNSGIFSASFFEFRYWSVTIPLTLISLGYS